MRLHGYVCLICGLLALNVLPADAQTVADERCKLVEELAVILSAVKDDASAKAALPKIEAMKAKFKANTAAAEKTKAPPADEYEQQRKKLNEAIEKLVTDATRTDGLQYSGLAPVMKDLGREMALLPFGERLGSKPTHTTVIDELVKITDDETVILQGVKDDASALAAVEKINELKKRFEDLKPIAQELGDPVPEVKHAMKGRARESFEKLKPEIVRIFPELVRNEKLSDAKTKLLAAIGALDQAMQLNPFKKN
jgi:hypothetical protein